MKKCNIPRVQESHLKHYTFCENRNKTISFILFRNWNNKFLWWEVKGYDWVRRIRKSSFMREVLKPWRCIEYRKRSVEVEVGGRHILEVTGSLRVVKRGQGSSGSRRVSARIESNITYYFCINQLESGLCRFIVSLIRTLK